MAFLQGGHVDETTVVLKSRSLVLLCQTHIVVVANGESIICAMCGAPSDALRMRPSQKLMLVCGIANSHLVLFFVLGACEVRNALRIAPSIATCVLQEGMARCVRSLLLDFSIYCHLQVG